MFFEISCYSTLIRFIINKTDINIFPQVESVLLLMLLSDQSLHVFILTHEILVTFSVPCLAERGSDRVALVGIWHPTRETHHRSESKSL